jgi:hypothetical protein
VLLDVTETCLFANKSRSALYRDVAAKRFPQPVRQPPVPRVEIFAGKIRSRSRRPPAVWTARQAKA